MEFLDKCIDRFHKGFISGDKYSDPTYLGFRFVFDFDPIARDFENAYTADPLFSDNANLESAARYLRANGYPQRALAIKKFKEILASIVKDTPWYFQSIEGLGNVWKVKQEGEFNPYRAKGLELTVTCLESIDMRITALADLYRKATFDPKYMRDLLPENLKWFSLSVQVAEIRSFQRVANAINKMDTQQQQQNANADQFVRNGQPVVDASNGFVPIENVDGLISIIEFELEHCEFDFSDSFPVDGPIAMGGGEMSMAKQSFKIRPRRVKEQNHYTLMDLLMTEGPNESANNWHIGGKTDLSSTGNSPMSKELDAAFNARSATGGSKSFNPLAAAAANMKSDLQRKLDASGANLIGKANQAVQQPITKAMFGNVYDLRNQSATTVFNSLVGKDQQAGINPLGQENALTPPAPIHGGKAAMIFNSQAMDANAAKENVLTPSAPIQPLGKEDVYPPTPPPPHPTPTNIYK